MHFFYSILCMTIVLTDMDTTVFKNSFQQFRLPTTSPRTTHRRLSSLGRMTNSYQSIRLNHLMLSYETLIYIQSCTSTQENPTVFSMKQNHSDAVSTPSSGVTNSSITSAGSMVILIVLLFVNFFNRRRRLRILYLSCAMTLDMVMSSASIPSLGKSKHHVLIPLPPTA